MSKPRHPDSVIMSNVLTAHGFSGMKVKYIDPGRDGGVVRLKVQDAPGIYDLPDVKLDMINKDVKAAFGDRYLSSDRWRTQRGTFDKDGRPKAYVVHLKDQ